MKRYKVEDYLLLTGIILILIPFVFLLFITLSHLGLVQDMILDYLIPLEFAFLVIPGALLLAVGSILSKTHVKITLILTSILILAMLYVMIAPVIFGFGSDSDLAHGFWFTFTFVWVGIYDIISIVLGILHIIWLESKIKDEKK
ncbi:MAG: hypothetical protein A2Y45_07070 [Tenericutes bacterium GWC2_34_14]|nr:MAG: hypothetical protein A2Y45_07070 [Tenericutes bacterium GWC2_34_14]OHE33371.1 MAG: hypothetical protein A2012_10270 [Tenericutes bacterium GWE2_34_108]OHE36672.1 MAG: hypothetical protein A2Y46_08545 [Tenericutes bacterium GWF1_35_14]OHE38248.1 MAG: hypothetical protein A2Y44_10120 [Tenericutes bacterium GWF2_35_184]OHE44955.1 MAG: hypothetical protein A2221_05030 [Tenericutes bacterium RIFOXYA2_FULL_36_32]OHE45426.1 MAG: hypothetical protein A3K26_07730 [Tenericutes bacterium RIFOXYA1